MRKQCLQGMLLDISIISDQPDDKRYDDSREEDAEIAECCEYMARFHIGRKPLSMNFIFTRILYS